MALESIKPIIEKLLDSYQNLPKQERNKFNEANTANVFIRPFFEALGWNFSDIDCVEAEKVILKGRVDYLLKAKKVTKFCLEIKSLRHDLTDDDRRQAIEYAYNKGVTWAILTNFDRIQVFNAEIRTYDLKLAQFFELQSENYLTSLEDLYLISKDSSTKDDIDKVAEKYSKVARRIPVQKRLYVQMTKWREGLFNHIYQFNKEKGITQNQVDLLIEKLFSRLIFIRTAEDRDLASNHPLLSALHQWQSSGQKADDTLLNRVKSIFKDFAETFDSELFPLIDPWEQIWVNEHMIAEIINGLYEVPGDYAKYYFNVIEPDVLGQVYEQYLGYVAKSVIPLPKLQQPLFPQNEEQFEMSLKKEKRKKGGIYYTPKWVTDYIVRQTIGRYIAEHTYEEIRNMKILDPACGSGSFLIRAYDELLQYHAKTKGKPLAELSWAERKEILAHNIFGVDLDPQAVEIAQLNLLIRALAQRESLPSLAKTIQCHNSLIFGADQELEKWFGSNFKNLRPIDWKSISENGFDIVIGNPPYVMELRDNKEIFRQLRRTEFGDKYYEPKMDIFNYFMELGIDLLKPEGYLGFIVQEYWISRTHASKLRNKVFSETHPLLLVAFKDYQVFQDAPGQHNMITVLKKSKDKTAGTLTLSLKNGDVSEPQIIKALASDADSQDLFEAKAMDVAQLYDVKTDKVYITEYAVSGIKAELAQNSWNLDDSEIQVGADVHQPSLRAKVMAQLAAPTTHKVGEGIFVLSKLELAGLKPTQEEQKILRPFHYAEELDRYYYKSDVAHYLIYTPNEIAKDIESNPYKYPNIKLHLDQYQAIITSDNKPYGIHRARQPEWFEDTSKIVGVRKTRYPKFVVVPEPWYGDQAVLIIRLTKHPQFSPHFASAVLNSKVGHFWLFQQKRQGNQLQVDKEVLLNFPFPKFDLSDTSFKKSYDKVITLVGKITKLKKEQEEVESSALKTLDDRWKTLVAEISETENQIDQLVFALYDLTEEETKQVEDVIKEHSWSSKGGQL